VEEQDLEQISDCSSNNFSLSYMLFLTLAAVPTQMSFSKN